MSTAAQEIVKQAALCRESGHTAQAARIVRIADRKFPEEQCVQREKAKVIANLNPSMNKRFQNLVARFVDRFGLFIFFSLMAYIAILLAPILFVSAK